VTPDPLASMRLFFDIGGAGAKADAMAIWVVQFAGDRILVRDYIEGQGQVLAYYVNELRARGHQGATIYLPHDGVNTNIVIGKRLEDHLRDAEFSVVTIKNQGPGAASMRIEAARRLFSKVWFNEATTEAGRDALDYYHERRDERRDVQLGLEHDWSSHAAGAFGLMAVCCEDPGVTRAFNRKTEYPRLGIAEYRRCQSSAVANLAMSTNTPDPNAVPPAPEAAASTASATSPPNPAASPPKTPQPLCQPQPLQPLQPLSSRQVVGRAGMFRHFPCRRHRTSPG
jgi:hypothetical protein